MFEFEYCLLFKGKNVFKLSNLIEDEVVLNVDQDCLVTILFIIKMKNNNKKSSEFGFKSNIKFDILRVMLCLTNKASPLEYWRNKRSRNLR